MKKAQGLLEYSLIIGCVTMALLAMQVYFKRGIQGVIKATSAELSSPAKDLYSALENRSVNPQFLGVEETGLMNYIQHEPTNVTRKQEIVTTELGRGERRFVINNDNTTTSGNWTVRYTAEDAHKYGTTDDKAETPTGATPGPVR